VTTGHLLGGLLAEGGNLALRVLELLEIEPARLQRELGRSSGVEPSEPSQEGLRFSGPAANALELTTHEAVGLGHNYIGCEHLLLGLVGEPEGTAGHALRALGAEQRLTRRTVSAALAGFVHLRAQAQSGQGGQPGAAQAQALTAAIQAELRPVVERLERLERLAEQR
jgi:ATP-dependent Clp protease ATP-binding subunit ClpA